MIFSEEALNALYNASKGNSKRLNSLIVKCLIIEYQNKKEIIDDEIVNECKRRDRFYGEVRNGIYRNTDKKYRGLCFNNR